MNTSSKILVAMADDHELHLTPVSKLLEEDEVITVIIQASDGRQLIEKIIALKQLPDVCLIDIRMDGLDGFQTVTQIKKLWPQIRCLVLTAFPDESNIIHMIRLGANGFLVKNVGPAEVIKAIKAVMEHEFYYSGVANETTYNLVKNNRVKIQEINFREMEFLKYVCSELTYPEIAAEMRTTPKAIKGIRDRLCEKLNVDTRVSLALAAVALQLYVPNPPNNIKAIQ